ncbi:MAG: hypothetical protein LBD68_08140, partial [Zoogloeaceae bacterium]|nr:hypothetical protein [Zoogloeaceae bacterium]
MNTFVIAPGCLPGYRTSETPPERAVGGLQTRPCRQFHRCKPLLTLPCQKLFLSATISLLHMAFMRLPWPGIQGNRMNTFVIALGYLPGYSKAKRLQKERLAAFRPALVASSIA